MKISNLLPKLGAWSAAVVAVACGAAPALAGWNPFVPGTRVEVDLRSGQLAIADFNGDGHGDILTAHSLDGKLSLLLGDGRGEFPLAGRSVIKLGYDPSEIAVGDVNCDSRPDLVAISRDGSTVFAHMLLNEHGALRENERLKFVAYEANQNGWKPAFSLADVNGDKHLDLIAGDGRQNFVKVLYGAGDGRFASEQTIAIDEGFNFYSHVVGDLNGDGRLDILMNADEAKGSSAGKLAVFLGDEQGKLPLAPDMSRDVPAGSKVKTLADVDGNGRLDVILTSGTEMTELAQTADGKLAPWKATSAPFAMGNEAFAMLAVPAGPDNNDVVVAAMVDSVDVLFLREGTFHHACGPIPAGPGAFQLTSGDLNGDGKDDVVANSFGGNSLSLLLSN